MPTQLPSDLLILISRLFTSALDLLSFALVCRRHYQLLLSKIEDKSDKQSQSLLDLHAKRILGFVYDLNHGVDLFYRLPKFAAHGQVRAWVIVDTDKKYEISLAGIAATYVKANTASHNTEGFSFASNRPYNKYVTDLRHQDEILRALPQKPSAVYHMHLGLRSGLWTNIRFPTDGWVYGYMNPHEITYERGKMHGLCVGYNPEGTQHDRTTTWRHGVEHGLTYSYKNNMLMETTQYIQGVFSGETQGFTHIQGLNVPVLTTRNHFDGASKAHGTWENWNAESGVRTSLANWNHGKMHGDVTSWYPDSGIVKVHEVYIYGFRTKLARYNHNGVIKS